jgi:hypothetical protein
MSLSGHNTCRKCSDPNSTIRACGLGYYLNKCSLDRDVQCVLCPSKKNVPIIEVYSEPGDCETTVCRPGFTKEIEFGNIFNSQCELCPVDFYCLGGYENIFRGIKRKLKCNENCTTRDKRGVVSAFGCYPKNNNWGVHTIYAFEYVVFVSSSLVSTVKIPFNGRCFDLDNIVYRNLEFGTFLKCSIESTNVAQFSRVICLVVVSECINNNEYKDWIRQHLNSSFSVVMKSTIINCLGMQTSLGIRVSSGFVYEYSKILGSLYQENIITYDDELKWMVSSNSTPDLFTPLLPWYDNRYIKYQLSGAFFMILMSSVFAIIILCGTSVVAYKYKQLIKKGKSGTESQNMKQIKQKS